MYYVYIHVGHAKREKQLRGAGEAYDHAPRVCEMWMAPVELVDAAVQPSGSNSPKTSREWRCKTEIIIYQIFYCENLYQ